jgi:hypothetical protein
VKNAIISDANGFWVELTSFFSQYSGGLLTKPIFKETWNVKDLLEIEDRQTVLTMLTAEQEKRQDEKEKQAVHNFEVL